MPSTDARRMQQRCMLLGASQWTMFCFLSTSAVVMAVLLACRLAALIRSYMLRSQKV
jgi:hypothetical protein